MCLQCPSPVVGRASLCESIAADAVVRWITGWCPHRDALPTRLACVLRSHCVFLSRSAVQVVRGRRPPPSGIPCCSASALVTGGCWTARRQDILEQARLSKTVKVPALSKRRRDETVGCAFEDRGAMRGPRRRDRYRLGREPVGGAAGAGNISGSMYSQASTSLRWCC